MTGQSPMSNFNSPASFMTASSLASFISAGSAFNSPVYFFTSGYSHPPGIETFCENEPSDPSMPAPLQQLRSDYYEILHKHNIIQPFDKELNWSGKGQHVTFPSQNNIPLFVLPYLGSSVTATIDKVLCRRIALARKTIRCNRIWTVADALQEVYHLQNLRHFHIIQLVGSYLQGRNFSILMYPVADSHLGTFLEDQSDLNQYYANQGPDDRYEDYLCINDTWRIYLAYFGLSRSFASQDHNQTDGPTSRTPRYFAPEVYDHGPRGRSADNFSLVCVLLEMLAVYVGYHLQEFANARRGDGDDESYRVSLGRVAVWITDTLKVDLKTEDECGRKRQTRPRTCQHGREDDVSITESKLDVRAHREQDARKGTKAKLAINPTN
ncbi:hypothetical protein EJ02DRAFT_464328 [Clathrospora elynae]|uniref:Protein kinase domain-containing protein n=1 Tax=Clathrospora elynae TaxID=706981 RepID=A0A6A5SWN7_9PLEO|nr:hypothetical protein EJ02DRAFT_464328 [Clathrospora elynae]